MKLVKLLLLLALLMQVSGCVLTKVVTVPMRVGGAAISVVPVVGNTIPYAVSSSKHSSGTIRKQIIIGLIGFAHHHPLTAKN